MIEKRRPVSSRNTKWAYSSARFLKNLGFTPNIISILSAVFAAIAGTFFWRSGGELPFRFGYLLLGVLFVQLRLICNLLDGMVAIEFEKKSKSGEIYNDFPDRLADLFILLGVGYAVRDLPYGVSLGWLAAFFAVLTAYVRVLGTSVGGPTLFIGPMAKQHRMAVVTLGALFCEAERFYHQTSWSLWGALILVVIGSAGTVARRLVRIVTALEKREG
jgi:phosphatidylglycerophosphate synthase